MGRAHGYGLLDLQRKDLLEASLWFPWDQRQNVILWFDLFDLSTCRFETKNLLSEE